MATVSRENIGVLTDKLTVKIAKDDYLPSFEKALKTYSKQANIPGFRKGMVPTGVIKKMYGNSVFAEEVFKSVEKELTQYLTNEKLNIFAQPLPLPENSSQVDMTRPEEYSFAFEIGLKPEFVLPGPEELKPIRYEIQVTDKMIDEEIDRLRNRHGKMTEPEIITADDNALKLHFVELDQQGEPVNGGIQKELTFPVSYFVEQTRKVFIGKKKEDTEKIRLAEVFDEKERNWVQKELGLAKEGDKAEADHFFNATITGIGLLEKAEINESLFDAAFPNRGIKTQEDFRNAIKEEVQAYLDEQSRGQLHHSLYHDLLKHTKIEFPESFLKRWMQYNSENPKSQGEIEQEFPVFESQLKWTLITDRIATENQIEVSPDDLRAFAKKQLLGYMGRPASGEEQPWIADYVNRMIQDKKFVEETAQRIQTDKIFAWIEGKADISGKSVSLEAFNEMQQEHQHHHH
jgi:trigger factor